MILVASIGFFLEVQKKIDYGTTRQTFLNWTDNEALSLLAIGKCESTAFTVKYLIPLENFLSIWASNTKCLNKNLDKEAFVPANFGPNIWF